MFDTIFFHMLGIICMFIILLCFNTAVRNIKKMSKNVIMLSIFAGIFYVISSYGILLFVYINTNIMTSDIFYKNTSITARLYIVSFLIMSLIIASYLLCKKIFIKHIDFKISISIAFIVHMSITLYPVAHIWISS